MSFWTLLYYFVSKNSWSSWTGRNRCIAAAWSNLVRHDKHFGASDWYHNSWSWMGFVTSVQSSWNQSCQSCSQITMGEQSLFQSLYSRRIVHSDVCFKVFFQPFFLSACNSLCIFRNFKKVLVVISSDLFVLCLEMNHITLCHRHLFFPLFLVFFIIFFHLSAAFIRRLWFFLF